MRRRFAIIALVAAAGCTFDASVVRTHADPDGTGAASNAGGAGEPFGGAAGAVNPGGGSGATAAGGAALGGKPVVPDLWQEHRYDWCMPPAYDFTLAHVPGSGCQEASSIQRDHRTVTILLDRSESMRHALPGASVSKWLSVRNALGLMAFEPTGFLDKWSLMTFANTPKGDDPSIVCDPTSYVPGTAVLVNPPRLTSVNTLIRDFDATSPTAPLRPTAIALQAAIAQTEASAAALGNGTRPSVVLITDGLPYGCHSGSEETDLKNVVAAANPAGAASFTPVHVIQLGDQFDLTEVARLGNTEAPYVILGGDVARQLVKILRRIFYPAPTNCKTWINFEKKINNRGALVDVEVIMESRYTGSALALPLLTSEGACASSPAGGFWITDSGISSEPYQISMCPCTCAAMGTADKTTATMYCSY